MEAVAVVGFVVPPGPSTPGADIGHDIFSISRDGQVRRLTHLTDHYGRLLTISPAGLSWSPDARYLAFWILYPDSPGLNWELVVYDTTAQKATDYCITNAGGSIRPLDAPIWSPDGRQLLVESRDAQGNNRVVILDLAQETAFLLSDNAYAAGWLAP